jgi:hypothetical protein
MQVMNHFKNLAMQVNKSSENYYLSDDTVIVADDRRSSVKGGPAPPAGSGLKSATEEKRTNYMHC